MLGHFLNIRLLGVTHGIISDGDVRIVLVIMSRG